MARRIRSPGRSAAALSARLQSASGGGKPDRGGPTRRCNERSMKHTRASSADSLGTVAENKLADLVLLDADPLIDIRNTTRIRAIIADGRLLERAGLDQLLTTAARGHRPD